MEPGQPGYCLWSRIKALEFLRNLCPPDVPLHTWVETVYRDHLRYHELAAAVSVCVEINDAGESYSSPNADGAMALANLFKLIQE
jgi:hypothetical protein